MAPAGVVRDSITSQSHAPLHANAIMHSNFQTGSNLETCIDPIATDGAEQVLRWIE